MAKKNIKRVKPKQRMRGFPALNLTSSNIIQPVESKGPTSDMDIARYLADEVHKKWPDAQLPATLSGKHAKLASGMLNEFSSENIKEIIRILVWDFETIKNNKGFFPPSSHLSYPWLDQLYNYRHALVSLIGKGVTDETSRVSAYEQKYVSNTQKPADTKPNTGMSSKDIARRILGQG